MDSSVTVARRYLEFFKAAGVPKIFGIPGVHNLPFWRDWEEGLPPIVGVRHEQTTVYAADGLARSSGGPAVALTTTGPGAANAVAAFGEAASCGSPVILVATEISTQHSWSGILKGVLHESRDQAGIFEPLAKAVFRPRTASEAMDALGAAVKTAMAWPRGPVYVDIPTDVLSHPAVAPELLFEERASADLPAIEELAALIEKSPRVVIWCGSGVIQSGAEMALRALAETLQAPVVTTYGARGVLPPDHPCHVSLPPHEPEVAQLIAEADLLLAVGTDFDGMMTRNWRMPMPKSLAVINCADEDLAKNYEPDVAVLADAREALTALLPFVSKRSSDADLLQTVDAGWRRLKSDERSAPGIAFVKSVESAVAPDTKVICDMAVAGYWFGGYGGVTTTRQLQYPVGWGTLGYALPAAIGPAAAGQSTLAICGDGGVMFALSELATISQEGLPVTLLVVDDGAYGMLAYDQEVAGDPRRGVELKSPDWLSLGQAFGIPTTVVDKVGPEFEHVLRAAVGSRQARFVILKAGLTPPRTTSARWSE